jgi:hypothetical protein
MIAHGNQHRMICRRKRGKVLEECLGTAMEVELLRAEMWSFSPKFMSQPCGERPAPAQT